MVMRAFVELHNSAGGLLSPWSRDVVEVVATCGTVLAFALGFFSLWVAKRAERRTNEKIAQGRERDHDRDVLKSLLEIAVRDDDSPVATNNWKLPCAYLRSLTTQTRDRLHVTPMFFNSDRTELRKALEKRGRGLLGRDADLRHVQWDDPGTGPGDAPSGRVVMAKIYDELIEAMKAVVLEGTDPPNPAPSK